MPKAQLKPDTASPDTQRTLDFVHGALGAAGHAMTDPMLVDLLERYVRGEISEAEYDRATVEQVLRS